jgi:DNA-binding NarL/FixJ family response regulator
MEVLQLVSLGLTDRQIGERLLICTKTASTHVAHILDKLGAWATDAAFYPGRRTRSDRGNPSACLTL